MSERTDNIDEMSIEQLRSELRAAWTRLRNVKAVIDDDFDRPKDDSPMRDNVAGDVQSKLHALLTRLDEAKGKPFRLKAWDLGGNSPR